MGPDPPAVTKRCFAPVGVNIGIALTNPEDGRSVGGDEVGGQENGSCWKGDTNSTAFAAICWAVNAGGVWPRGRQSRKMSSSLGFEPSWAWSWSTWARLMPSPPQPDRTPRRDQLVTLWIAACHYVASHQPGPVHFSPRPIRCTSSDSIRAMTASITRWPSAAWPVGTGTVIDASSADPIATLA